jgi:hypothetical protein
MSRVSIASEMRGLTKQAASLISAYRKQELPSNPRRGRRNGDQIPLSAWMAGAEGWHSSKISAVVSGSARYPYRSLAASRNVLRNRIASRYKICGAQLYMLNSYLEMRYRGASSTSIFPPDGVADKGLDLSTILVAVDWLVDCASGRPLPLSAILSQKLADLIVQFQLYATLKEAA